MSAVKITVVKINERFLKILVDGKLAYETQQDSYSVILNITALLRLYNPDFDPLEDIEFKS